MAVTSDVKTVIDHDDTKARRKHEEEKEAKEGGVRDVCQGPCNGGSKQ
jgi:hypothetical protein